MACTYRPLCRSRSALIKTSSGRAVAWSFWRRVIFRRCAGSCKNVKSRHTTRTDTHRRVTRRPRLFPLSLSPSALSQHVSGASPFTSACAAGSSAVHRAQDNAPVPLRTRPPRDAHTITMLHQLSLTVCPPPSPASGGGHPRGSSECPPHRPAAAPVGGTAMQRRHGQGGYEAMRLRGGSGNAASPRWHLRDRPEIGHAAPWG